MGNFFWMPEMKLEQYVQARVEVRKTRGIDVLATAEYEKAKETLFRHLCNHVARVHDHDSDDELVPSGFLDVEITKCQKRLLRPKLTGVVQGKIMKDILEKEPRERLQKGGST